VQLRSHELKPAAVYKLFPVTNGLTGNLTPLPGIPEQDGPYHPDDRWRPET